MSDLYTDFASDYEWLFADDVVGSSPRLGATSAGGRDLLEAAIAQLTPGAPVLDCACGVGADALALVQRGFAVTATDASSSMIARARERVQGMSALGITYEELTTAPSSTSNRVLTFLGVDPEPALSSRYRKLLPPSPLDSIENGEEVQEVLKGSRFEAFLAT